MSKVFITGATGVIGRRVVPRLVADGHDVIVARRRSSRGTPDTFADMSMTVAGWVNMLNNVSASPEFSGRLALGGPHACEGNICP